jgi:hypothetical protein
VSWSSKFSQIIHIYNTLESKVLDGTISLSEMDSEWLDVLSTYGFTLEDWENEIDRRWEEDIEKYNSLYQKLISDKTN